MTEFFAWGQPERSLGIALLSPLPRLANQAELVSLRMFELCPCSVNGFGYLV